MLEQIGNQLELFIEASKLHVPLMLKILAFLWIVNIINWFTGCYLHLLGLYPRKFFGLVGIVFAPIIHGGFNHLFFNSIPLFSLGLLLLTQGVELFIAVTLIVAVIQGGLVWCFGRSANHIGASGVIAGYFGYIIITAYTQPTITTIFLGAITLYYFGSILFSIFPTQERVSWEGHLAGLLAGFAAYPIYHNFSVFL